MPSKQLVLSLQRKFHENQERTEHLISLIPTDHLTWRPENETGSYSTIGNLLGHMLCCFGGFCAVMHRAFPEELKHIADLRLLEVNHFCHQEEAIERIRLYSKHVDEGFSLADDSDLERLLPTVFVPEGETMLTLLLNNLEHLTSHKYQLFFYLKLLGLQVGTRDIYHFHKIE